MYLVYELTCKIAYSFYLARAAAYYHGTVYLVLRNTYRYQKIKTVLATRISLRGKRSSAPRSTAARPDNRICFS